MPTITIDGKRVECRDGIPVLRAALEADFEVPHYCYHPGLSVVASCRLCLMEMKVKDPRSGEMTWSPRLVPSCQTPVQDGMEVRFHSPGVAENQKHVMEYYLLNHPLDCPVCDKAGECYLQDYTEQYGSAASRMVEEKHKNPKKDIGPYTLLYQDRCVLCTRCVRFCQEVAGTGELAVVERGSRGEIDVFPGEPLANKLQGNVVDICPVGCLLDKGFLFKQRVWELHSTKSVCAGCSRGCTIDIDHYDGNVRRLRPRYNEKVNEWWICDEGRFGWKYIHSDQRLDAPLMRRDGGLKPTQWEGLAAEVRAKLSSAIGGDEGAALAAVLSPMMSCEEAWLLAKFIRGIAPRATLVSGFVPVTGKDETFQSGFTINAEKCPNQRGVKRVIESFGGPSLGFDTFVSQVAKYRAAYVVGGYPGDWVSDAAAQALGRIETLIVHDLFKSKLWDSAVLVIPGASWAEREGAFVNCDGLLQAFERAIKPQDGVKFDGQFLYELAGESGMFRAAKVRQAMAVTIPDMAALFVPRQEPKYAH